MKVRYIKSATVVIEHQGIKVLCDPWLTDGIYYGSWFHYPPLKFSAADFQDIDYIYISHVHPDHCDAATLKDLPKHVPVVIHDFQEKFLLNALKRLGFQRVIEVGNRQELVLGSDFKMEVIAGDDCNAARFMHAHGHKLPGSYNKTLQIDSLAVFHGGGKTVLNTNDVPIALISDTLSYIKSKYSCIDFLLVSYAGAGPFPQANAMTKERMLDAAVHAAYSYVSGTFAYLRYTMPKYFMPYAGQYTLGGKFGWMNDYKGTLELDECILDVLPAVKTMGLPSEMVLLDSGETFDVDSKQASKPFTPTDSLARAAYVKDVLSKKTFEYEVDEPVPDDFLERIQLARETLWAKQQYYGFFDDSNVYIDVGHDHKYAINFKDKEVTRCDVVDEIKPFFHAQLDPRLLQRILDRRANWNNAEVGSHIVLYDWLGRGKDPGKRSYNAMPHFMMAYFQLPSLVRPTVAAGVVVGKEN